MYSISFHIPTGKFGDLAPSRNTDDNGGNHCIFQRMFVDEILQKSRISSGNAENRDLWFLEESRKIRDFFS